MSEFLHRRFRRTPSEADKKVPPVRLDFDERDQALTTAVLILNNALARVTENPSNDELIGAIQGVINQCALKGIMINQGGYFGISQPSGPGNEFYRCVATEVGTTLAGIRLAIEYDQNGKATRDNLRAVAQNLLRAFARCSTVLRTQLAINESE